MHKFSRKMTVRESSLKCLVIDQWNNLPRFVVVFISRNSFKNFINNLDKHQDIIDDPVKNLSEINLSH